MYTFIWDPILPGVYAKAVATIAGTASRRESWDSGRPVVIV